MDVNVNVCKSWAHRYCIVLAVFPIAAWLHYGTGYNAQCNAYVCMYANRAVIVHIYVCTCSLA